MTATEHYGLAKPELNDLYGDYISSQCDNADKIDSVLYSVKQAQGGLTLQTLTPEAYAAIPEPDLATVYFVSDGEKLEIYLGTAKVSGGGSAPAVAAVSALGVMGTVGDATKIEEVEQ